MEKAYVTYKRVNEIIHIELTINGSWEGGGNTGVKTEEEAYNFACKIATSKNARVECFRCVS